MADLRIDRSPKRPRKRLSGWSTPDDHEFWYAIYRMRVVERDIEAQVGRFSVINGYIFDNLAALNKNLQDHYARLGKLVMDMHDGLSDEELIARVRQAVKEETNDADAGLD